MPANSPDVTTAQMSDFDAFVIRSGGANESTPAQRQYAALKRQALAQPAGANNPELTAQIAGMEQMAGARGGYTTYGGTPLGMRAEQTQTQRMDPVTIRRVYGEGMWRRMFPQLAAAEDAARRQAEREAGGENG